VRNNGTYFISDNQIFGINPSPINLYDNSFTITHPSGDSLTFSRIGENTIYETEKYEMPKLELPIGLQPFYEEFEKAAKAFFKDTYI
jgi:hypothetical protein